MIAERLSLYVAATQVIMSSHPTFTSVAQVHSMRTELAEATSKLTDSLGAYEFGWMRINQAYAAEFAPLKTLDWSSIFMAGHAAVARQGSIDGEDINIIEASTSIDNLLALVGQIAVYEPEQKAQWEPLQQKIVSNPMWPLAMDIVGSINQNPGFDCSAIPNCTAVYRELVVVVNQILENNPAALHPRK